METLMKRQTILPWLVVALLLALKGVPLAEGAAMDPAPPVPGLPATPPPAPYSLPWGLRALIPATVARLDTVVAFYDDKKGHQGITTVFMPLFSYKFSPSISGLLRWGVIGNFPPVGDASAS